MNKPKTVLVLCMGWMWGVCETFYECGGVHIFLSHFKKCLLILVSLVTVTFWRQYRIKLWELGNLKPYNIETDVR